MIRLVAFGGVFVGFLGACGPDPDETLVARARAAGVGVDTTGCNENTHGSGFHLTADLVVTSAHVVAGAATITLTDALGAATTATVTHLDPVNDLALLRTAPLSMTDFALISSGNGAGAGNETEEADQARASGDDPTLVVVSRNGQIELLPATIVRRVTIRTQDIYLDTKIERPGYEVSADIHAGDSGGAVIENGQVVGVIWSRSRAAEGRAWAIDTASLGPIVAGTEPAVVPADTNCH